ncbi:MAG: 5-formyltetrahydrofolate cyclo-ligase [Verrucomicrobiota bacterium]
MSPKRELRRQLFAKLRGLSDGEISSHSERIVDLLLTDSEFRAAKTIASFLPMRSEPDLTRAWAENDQATWLFSRVTSDSSIEFHHVERPDQLREGEYGFPEPDPSTCRLADPSEASVFLVPGVGFDPKTGHRIGRGKGHYDRYLNRARIGAPAIWGICFETQFTSLEPEPHDIGMHRLLSETGWRDFP